MRLQLSCKAGVKHNVEHGSDMLMFTFHLGPLEVFCLAHFPKVGQKETIAYIKVTLKGRTVVDVGSQKIENWVYEDEEASLQGGDKERVELGPMLLYVEGGEMRVALRERTIIDPKHKSFEEWRAAK